MIHVYRLCCIVSVHVTKEQIRKGEKQQKLKDNSETGREKARYVFPLESFFAGQDLQICLSHGTHFAEVIPRAADGAIAFPVHPNCDVYLVLPCPVRYGYFGPGTPKDGENRLIIEIRDSVFCPVPTPMYAKVRVFDCLL